MEKGIIEKDDILIEDEFIKSNIVEDTSEEEQIPEVPATYVKDGQIIHLPYTLDEKYNIGSTYEDYRDGKYVALSEEQLAFLTDNPDASILEVWSMKLTPPYMPTLKELKGQKISEIEAYDSSDAVNGFMIGGVREWLSKNDRVSLRNLVEQHIAVGREVSELWLNGRCFTLPCLAALEMLKILEVYAGDCFNVAATHKDKVSKLETSEEIESYDYTVGYPDMPEFPIG